MLRKGDVARLSALTVAERIILCEALCWVLIARGLLTVLPFRIIATSFGLRTGMQAGGNAAVQPHPFVLVAIRRIGARAPGIGTCLAQALAGAMMLERRGVRSQLFLGVAREDGHLRAHAWLVCCGNTVLGATEARRFAPIAVYHSGNKG